MINQTDLASLNLEKLLELLPSAFLVVRNTGELIHLNTKARDFLHEICLYPDIQAQLDKPFLQDYPMFLSPLIQTILEAQEDIPRSDMDILAPDKAEPLILGFTLRIIPVANTSTLRILVFSDITEVVRQRKAFEDLTAQLYQSKKLASLGTLISGVAHELNNPLTGMSMSCQLATRAIKPLVNANHPMGQNLSQEVRSTLNQVLIELSSVSDSVHKASVLVQDLLDYARPVQQTDVQTLDLNHMLKTLLSHIASQDLFSKMTWHCSPWSSPAWVRCNPTKLEQVFFNLIRNARDATNGQGHVTIQVMAMGGQEGWQVTVTDNGPGIDKSALAHLFDPFFTTKGPKGVGLGLSISFRTIEQHNGKLSVDNVSPHGAQFTVTLPQQPSESLIG